MQRLRPARRLGTPLGRRARGDSHACERNDLPLPMRSAFMMCGMLGEDDIPDGDNATGVRESSATHSTKAYFDCALRNGTVGLIQNQRLEFPKYGVVGNFRPSRLIRPPLYRYCDFAGTVDSMKFGRGGFEPDGIMPVCLRERDGLQANTLDGRVADQRGTDARLILI